MTFGKNKAKAIVKYFDPIKKFAEEWSFSRLRPQHIFHILSQT